MTFWTDGRDPTKRTWQCFVCGHKTDTYEDYATHILEQHEAGRDYIKCPVDVCGAPVRDLRAHYKLKHPNRIIPKNVQYRVTLWRDFKSGKPKTRKPVFKDGWHESTKMGGKKMFYRSSYEADVFLCLDADKDVKAFHNEPFKVPYYFRNEWHNYIPDIKVEYQNGLVDIWEIKPKTQLDLEQNQAKWNAMEGYAEKMGWGFTVLTENEINGLKRKVKRQLRETDRG